MKILDKRQILLLHDALIKETGGANGIREEGLLESAVYAPMQTYLNQSAYPSLQQKAARLGYGIVRNHPFVDGNKRTGAHAMLVFLALNGVELDYTQEQLANIFLDVADSKIGYDELLEWILAHEQ